MFHFDTRVICLLILMFKVLINPSVTTDFPLLCVKSISILLSYTASLIYCKTHYPGVPMSCLIYDNLYLRFFGMH